MEKLERKEITSGLVLNGAMLEESRERENRIKPRKKIDLLIILDFFPTNPKKNPMIMSIGANSVDCRSTSWAVMVVPILLPKIIPKLFLKEIIPVLTNTTVITVIAELDCTIAVEIAPRIVPIYLFLTSFPIPLRNFSAASSWISLLRFSIA